MSRSLRRFVRLAVVLGLVAAACSPVPPSRSVPPTATSPIATSFPGESPASSAAATPTPTPRPSSTPVPTVPPDLPQAVIVEQDGVQVTVELERNPMPAGDPTWATLTVTNVGSELVTWLHDSCAIPAHLRGTLAPRWRPGPLGTGLSGKYQFRAAVLWRYGLDEGLIRIEFVEEEFIGLGSYGCADIAILETLAPGESRTQRARWDGMAQRSFGPAPGGPVTLAVWAGYYWPTAAGEHSDGAATDPIEFDFPGWITGTRGIDLLDPPEVLDRAIIDPEFGGWLNTQDVLNGNEPRFWYDPEEGVWHVELLSYYRPESWIHGVTVHPVSGEILETLDYPWDGSFEHHG